MVTLSQPRPCVGVVIVNNDKKVFVGKRVMKKGVKDEYWQMPQGGIDAGEEPEEALKRELMEEIGAKPEHLDVIAVSKNWYSYHIPKKFQKRHFASQAQKWFLVKFTGKDEDLDVKQLKPEFSEWKWEDFKKVPKLVIDFKKDVYKQIFKDFSWYFENDEK